LYNYAIGVGNFKGYTGIAGGQRYSMAVMPDGVAQAWGQGSYGKLGNGSGASRTSPTSISITNAVAVDAGQSASLVLKSDGTVWVFGRNEYGQMGDGSLNGSHYTPQQVPGLTNVVAIAAGWTNLVALKADGTVWGWGKNTWGQVGDGTFTDRLSPVQVSGLTNIVSIETGSDGPHGTAIRADGTVWCWGWGGSGELAQGNSTNHNVPVQAKDPAGTGLLANVKAVGTYCGRDAQVITADGQALIWGGNSRGSVGVDPTPAGAWRQALPLLKRTGVSRSVGGGMDYSFSTTLAGVTSMVGQNIYGEFGDGPLTPNPTYIFNQRLLTTITTPIAMAAGDGHTIARMPTWDLCVTGDNTNGELGLGHNVSQTTFDCSIVILPVEMIRFTGKSRMDGTNLLEWATQTEIDNRGFGVERSIDGKIFVKIGWVDGHGNSNYQKDYTFVDDNVLQGVTHYYRLKQEDWNGEVKFSNVIALNSKNSKLNGVSITNTMAGKDYQLLINSSKDQNIVITIYDKMGRLIASKNTSVESGVVSLPLENHDLAHGVYTASFYFAKDEEYVTRKFYK